MTERSASLLALPPPGCRKNFVETPVAKPALGREIIEMSFAQTLDNLPLQKSTLVRGFEELIAPKSDAELESMARTSRALTLQNFGRTMRLFAPLYLSNECINNCRYCGFSRDNPILRVTLSVEEVAAEAHYLQQAGFRQVLLVAGEHPKFVSGDYLVECVRALASDFPSIAIEVGPMASSDYVPIVRAGAEGLVVYQETYQRAVYAELHTAGPKRDFDYRLDCPERAYAAGFRRLGVGALFGLWRWQDEAIALAAHVDYLLRRCWQAQITISLPRLRPAAGGFRPLGLRFAHQFSSGRDCLEHARTAFFARRAGIVRRNDDERREPHRARRLHPPGHGTSASDRGRSNHSAGFSGRRRQASHRSI